MIFCVKLHGIMLIFVLIFSNFANVKSKSVRIRTSKGKQVAKPKIDYSQLKVPKPTKPYYIDANQRKTELVRQDNSVEVVSENSQNVIETTFNSGIGELFQFIRSLTSNVFPFREGNAESSVISQETNLPSRLPGFPLTQFFHHLDTSSIVKLLQATDPSEAESLAQAAVVDFVSQLVDSVGFQEIRESLGIFLMNFVLGPILIPLFWLPISLFGMVGLLVPLFFWNPPSKPNVDVMGHDPIIPEGIHEKRSHGTFLDVLKNSSFPKSIFAQTSRLDIWESCTERVSCHFKRMYRQNPISKWLTSHFNTTKVEWARIHPGDEISENGISSWEDCNKYACSLFAAA